MSSSFSLAAAWSSTSSDTMDEVFVCGSSGFGFFGLGCFCGAATTPFFASHCSLSSRTGSIEIRHKTSSVGFWVVVQRNSAMITMLRALWRSASSSLRIGTPASGGTEPRESVCNSSVHPLFLCKRSILLVYLPLIAEFGFLVIRFFTLDGLSYGTNRFLKVMTPLFFLLSVSEPPDECTRTSTGEFPRERSGHPESRFSKLQVKSSL